MANPGSIKNRRQPLLLQLHLSPRLSHSKLIAVAVTWRPQVEAFHRLGYIGDQAQALNLDVSC
jgi:hypothetical protein